MMLTLGSTVPFAHAGHVLIDLPIYLGPVIVLGAWLLFSNWRDRRAAARGDVREPRKGSRGG